MADRLHLARDEVDPRPDGVNVVRDDRDLGGRDPRVIDDEEHVPGYDADDGRERGRGASLPLDLR